LYIYLIYGHILSIEGIYIVFTINESQKYGHYAKASLLTVEIFNCSCLQNSPI